MQYVAVACLHRGMTLWKCTLFNWRTPRILWRTRDLYVTSTTVFCRNRYSILHKYIKNGLLEKPTGVALITNIVTPDTWIEDHQQRSTHVAHLTHLTQEAEHAHEPHAKASIATNCLAVVVPAWSRWSGRLSCIVPLWKILARMSETYCHMLFVEFIENPFRTQPRTLPRRVCSAYNISISCTLSCHLAVSHVVMWKLMCFNSTQNMKRYKLRCAKICI